jgi:RimJ/RimL family protein N-acetyltransferase
LQIPTFATERLILRPFIMADFTLLAALYQTPRASYIGGMQPAEKVWRDFASDCGIWHLMGFGSLSIEEKATGALVGQTGLNAPPEYPERELGWVLFEGFEGKGYAFEAVSALRSFAFDTLRWTTLVSYIDPDNIRSIRLAEKLGAVLDREAERPRGDNCLVYRHSTTPL